MGEKLKSEDAKNYKIVSRVLGVLMRISSICCWVGVVCVAIVAIATAIVAPNIKVDSANKEITLFNQTSSYTIKDKDLEIVSDDEKARIVIKDNTISAVENGTEVFSIKISNESLTQMEEFIEEDAVRILAVLPYTLALAAVSLSLVALALGHVAKVLKTIANK
ncbi:hypothetical protein J6X90_02635, partial [Candidatus Saccharibacteria bacterium]|nr:hypothetical protein [Candidatus Saccharibacteria bacterium]